MLNIQKTKYKKRKKSGKRGLRYWIVATTAAGVLFAYTVGNSRAMNLAFEPKTSETISDNLKKDLKETAQKFDIPAGTLEDVLTAFEKTAGIRVIIPDNNFNNILSKGVKGNFTSEEALVQILADTGLTYNFTGTKTVTLRLLGINETVQVISEDEVISSPKYSKPIKDTPQTITVINKKSIEQQGATTLREVLQNVPGLTITAGEGGAAAGDNLTLRGFSASNDIFVDGVRDLGPQSRDPFNLEQVEVVKGPTSAVAGRGSTGGTINLVSKTPTINPFYNFSLTLGTDETKRVSGDINVPLDKLGLGERTAFRLNALYHDSNFPGRDVVENNRWGIAPTLSFGLGRNTLLTLGYFRLQQDNISDYGIPFVPATNNALIAFRDRPAPVPRDTFYGFLDRDKEKLVSDLFTVQLNHTFNDAFSVRNLFRFGNSIRDSFATPPRFASNDSTVINRELRTFFTDNDIFANQTDFSARFNTGKIRHSLVTGVEISREIDKRTLRTGPNATTTLLNPNPNDIYTGTIITNPLTGDLTADSQAFYIFDTISFGEKFDLTGGIRYDRFDANGIVAATAAPIPFSRVDQLPSFRFGAVFKPFSNGNIYTSVSSSLNPSLEGLSFGAVSDTVAPEKSYNYEIGTKWDLLNNRVLLTAAIFRVDKTNARTPGLPGEPPIVLDGRQRVDGIELGISGRIVRGWSVQGAYTLLDSRTLESNQDLVGGISQSVGKRLINTPRNSFSLFSTYQIPFGLTVGGGARFVGERFGNRTNTRLIDNYWLFDAVASYRISKNVDLKVNLYNITDKYYFDRIGGGHLVPGAGRSALFGFGFNF